MEQAYPHNSPRPPSIPWQQTEDAPLSTASLLLAAPATYPHAQSRLSSEGEGAGCKGRETEVS